MTMTTYFPEAGNQDKAFPTENGYTMVYVEEGPDCPQMHLYKDGKHVAVFPLGAFHLFRPFQDVMFTIPGGPTWTPDRYTKLHKAAQMGAYTFELSASVTVHARNEHEARQKLIDECLIQDEDVEYGKGLGVYLSLEEAMDAELVEINLEDEQ